MNKHGLSRTIPADVKRSVRQRCAFGCVICGASIYEYDHFDPPYADATQHTSEGITLLCPTHHAEKSRGVLPIETLLKANATPVALEKGQTSLQRPYFDHIPSLALGGGLLVHATPIPLMVGGVAVIEFLVPEADSHIARINAVITNDDGSNLLRIVENEWIVESGVWDYEWVGQRMTIRDNSGTVALQITIHPPKFISIDKLRFKTGNYDVVITQTEMKVNGNTFVDCIANNCRVGMALG
ncbi:MAG TPA: hypothetical protein VM842_00220 [Nitrospira sp.]|jgi:hypothetical protein|nr:hypothetical protein [Nitrospira sp.]